MVDFVILDNIADARALVTKLNSFLGYPNEATKTQRYTRVKEHETTRGQFLVLLKDVYSPLLQRKAELNEIELRLSDTERGAKRPKEELEKEGAFPVDEILPEEIKPGEGGGIGGGTLGSNPSRKG